MTGVYRVLLVDDHLLFRRGIKAILTAHADLRLAGEADDYGGAMHFLRSNSCDVMIVDLTMPGRDGLDLIDSVKAIYPKLAVLVLTMHNEEEYATRAIRGGANGYLTKDATEDELVDAIRRVATGRTAISHKVAEVVAVQLSRKRESPAPLAALSSREFGIYEMLARGMRISEIARDLNLSIKTISTYKIRLLQKLGLQSQCDVVLHRLRHFAEHSGDACATPVEPQKAGAFPP